MFGRFISLIVFVSVLTSCSNDVDRLEKIKAKGELVVLTRNAATTYYKSREGYLGVEYEMAKAFADSINVKARFILKDDVSDLFSSLNNGDADFAAAGLTHTKNREINFLFGPSYQMVSQQLVCRRGGKKPKKLENLTGITIHVPASSSYVEQLKKVKNIYSEIEWQEVNDIDTETLLKKVWLKKVDCTIADSNIVAINRRYYPELLVRFDVAEPEPLAWVFSHDDNALKELVNAWFIEYKLSGKFEEVMHRYYGYIERFDFVDTRAYQRKIKTHLPKYKNIFITAAAKYQLSWTLLAAQSYQESHWRSKAKSPTGVRGMMMLTQITAKELGIENRLDPRASIMGGANY